MSFKRPSKFHVEHRYTTPPKQAARSAKADHDPSRQAQTDAVLALIALGFKQTEAQKAITELVKQPGFDPATSTPDKLIRDSLRVLNF